MLKFLFTIFLLILVGPLVLAFLVALPALLLALVPLVLAGLLVCGLVWLLLLPLRLLFGCWC